MATFPLKDLLDGTRKLFTKTEMSKRIVRIAEVTDFAVPAGQTPQVFSLLNDEIVDFAYLWVALRVPAGSHPFQIRFQWMEKPAYGYDDPVIVFESDKRGTSEWIEVKSDKLLVFIRNNSSDPVTYGNIALFGVR